MTPTRIFTNTALGIVALRSPRVGSWRLIRGLPVPGSDPLEASLSVDITRLKLPGERLWWCWETAWGVHSAPTLDAAVRRLTNDVAIAEAVCRGFGALRREPS